MSKRIDPKLVSGIVGTQYPKPHDEPCLRRERRRLGDVANLTQFGVNLLRLSPGAWSSQRHWHTAEDEFVFVVEGEVVLVTDGGEEILRTGDCAGFKANDPNGHHLQNRSLRDAVLLEVGSRDPRDGTFYSDIDMQIAPGSDQFTHRDGSPFNVRQRHDWRREIAHRIVLDGEMQLRRLPCRIRVASPLHI